MADGIEIEGMEEFTEMLEDMTIDEADEKKAVRKGIEVVAKRVESNTPVLTGKLKKIKKSVKKEGFATVGTVKLGAWWDLFQEFGTSQQKHHVGFFDRAVKDSENEAVEIVVEELLDKVR
ncbi:hypothetical protein HYH50_03190 [Clostridium botulinum]|uniref:HK97-gp10 family putative phage morphogenesis protein n=1 Tax=Clostridium botulinum TaxID=1491 RepID=UPI000D37B6D2|nr:HK97-gp10 family putative phage morphogenesis protein [Clostridium botulinum]AWB17259.1 hypothetical protein DB732_07220 [Clostridium botulinum]EGT5616418.1 hypothetical protein [Clostridium botulinum]EGT5623171.1 hypothetical protein [Clostridium botulinum]EGT5626309.1 hypothetical protein [Clostridium botulinum]EGT5628692.1 hypothetical protein [Clostridium botulinum]